LGLLKSGQGLVSEIKGATQLLDQVKSLPGVGALLADIPGSAEILGSLQSLGPELLSGGLGALGLDTLSLDALGLDISALTDFDASALLDGAQAVLEEAAPLAEAAFEAIASFW
jgi:hypothetical protein